MKWREIVKLYKDEWVLIDAKKVDNQLQIERRIQKK